MEPISCMMPKGLDESLSSMPSSALDNEIIKRSMNPSAPPTSSGFTRKDDKGVRNSDRPANITDVTAVFNWWVGVICHLNRHNVRQENEK